MGPPPTWLAIASRQFGPQVAVRMDPHSLEAMSNGDFRTFRAGQSNTVSRQGRSSKGVFAGLGLCMMALADPAAAADLPLKAPALRAIFDWTGFYVGAHVGYGGGPPEAV